MNKKRGVQLLVLLIIFLVSFSSVQATLTTEDESDNYALWACNLHGDDGPCDPDYYFDIEILPGSTSNPTCEEMSDSCIYVTTPSPEGCWFFVADAGNINDCGWAQIAEGTYVPVDTLFSFLSYTGDNNIVNPDNFEDVRGQES